MNAQAPRPTAQEDLPATVALLRRAFPGVAKFTPAYLEWQYHANPTGPALVSNLFEGGRLVGHVSGVPLDVMLNGAEARVSLIINVCLDPEARGGGRFRALIEHLLAQSAAAGCAGAIGVANGQSAEGFVRALGFQDLGSLPAWVELAPHRLDGERALAEARFARHWRPETLAWRLANPANPLCVVARDSDALTIEGRSTLTGVAVRATLPNAGLDVPVTARPTRRPAVALGLAPAGTLTRRFARDIPQRLRPSPLRLIWHELRAGSAGLDRARLLFSLLDFDAF